MLAATVKNEKMQLGDAEDEECPICRTEFEFPIKTSCGHKFCGRCFMTLWDHVQTECVECPYCRTPVFQVKPAFPLEPIPDEDGERKGQVVKQMKEYNQGWGMLKKLRKSGLRCMLDPRWLFLFYVAFNLGLTIIVELIVLLLGRQSAMMLLPINFIRWFTTLFDLSMKVICLTFIVIMLINWNALLIQWQFLVE